jgi:hypothetical protein
MQLVLTSQWHDTAVTSRIFVPCALRLLEGRAVGAKSRYSASEAIKGPYALRRPVYECLPQISTYRPQCGGLCSVTGSYLWGWRCEYFDIATRHWWQKSYSTDTFGKTQEFAEAAESRGCRREGVSTPSPHIQGNRGGCRPALVGYESMNAFSEKIKCPGERTGAVLLRISNVDAPMAMAGDLVLADFVAGWASRGLAHPGRRSGVCRSAWRSVISSLLSRLPSRKIY